MKLVICFHIAPRRSSESQVVMIGLIFPLHIIVPSDYANSEGIFICIGNVICTYANSIRISSRSQLYKYFNEIWHCVVGYLDLTITHLFVNYTSDFSSKIFQKRNKNSPLNTIFRGEFLLIFNTKRFKFRRSLFKVQPL